MIQIFAVVLFEYGREMRAVIISSSGSMNDNIAEGLVDLANGHYIRGLKKMMKKQ